MHQDKIDPGNEWQLLLDGFEIGRALLSLENGAPLGGPTAEIVQELRRHHDYAGVPVPFGALRSHSDAAPATPAGTADMQPPTDMSAWFAAGVAARLGVRIIHLDANCESYSVRLVNRHIDAAAPGSTPLARSKNVPAPHLLRPAHALLIPMQIEHLSAQPSRHADALLRRNMASIVQAALDRVIFQGRVDRGEPAGVIHHAIDYGISVSVPIAAASWALFRREIAEIFKSTDACDPGAINVLLRPEIWEYMDTLPKNASSTTTEWDRLVRKTRCVIPSSVALEPPVSHESKVMLTTGQPIFCGLWGAMDLTPGTDTIPSTTGALPITARITCDVALDQASQVRLLFKIKSA